MSSHTDTPATTPANQPPRRAAVIFIFITVLLDVLSLGLIIPVLPTMIKEEFLQNDLALAAVYVGWFGTLWALMQFLFSPLMGAISDQFGRRPVILISCFGLGLDYVLMAVAPNIVWLFVGRALSGIMAASFSTAGAYIADVTPPEKRAASFGLIGAAWGIGFVVGPAVGGGLGEYGLRLPLWFAAGLTLLNALYGYFILPESLAVENRSKFSWKKANPLGALKLLRSHAELLGLASVLLIYQLAHQVLSNVFVLYTEHRYAWTPKTIGLTLTVVGIMSVVMQGFVVRRTAAKLGEWRMLFIALICGGIGYSIYGLAATGGMFWAAIPVFAFVGYFSPAIQGLMTRRVNASEQGQLQGANSCLMGIAGMLGPVMFTNVFSKGIQNPIGELPGAPFFLAAGLHVTAIVVALVIMRRSRKMAEA
ncbi:TCR/Tet family MFS transporter [Aureliella helgolandensis]|uniref:Tetracycline resistance protein, class C n=1 Tax=Aureliella helgolandensis TaxID=2527968 RepID=A0A518GES8_9BACT|nr:TCR/Tet family MFS transporter [Aureliella helgolandensis]QDV27058.1 Tetracycline resistance protein, class C [Aureliella helgolandensis]